MVAKKHLRNIFTQLSEALRRLTDNEYRQPRQILFNASIGEHVRHTIEFFLCLEKGYESGVVNYEKRDRDYRIESDKDFAVTLLEDIYDNIDKPNINLLLKSDEIENKTGEVFIATNYYREIIYNLEHAIHHMALIRVGINEVSTIEIPGEFGVAGSTIKFRKQSA